MESNPVLAQIAFYSRAREYKCPTCEEYLLWMPPVAALTSGSQDFLLLLPKTFHFLRDLFFWNRSQHGGQVRMVSIFQLDRFLEKFLLPILFPFFGIQSLLSFLVELQHNIFLCKLPLIAIPTNTHSFLSSLRFTIMQFQEIVAFRTGCS